MPAFVELQTHSAHSWTANLLRINMVTVTSVDLLTLATSLPYVADLYTTENSTSSIQFLSYNDTFANNILGQNVSSKLVADLGWPAFHEAGVYNKKTNSVYIASNYVIGEYSNQVNISIVSLDDYSVTSRHYPNLFEANGGCTYTPPTMHPNGSTTVNNTELPPYILFCDEGDLTNTSSIVQVDPVTNTTKLLINNFLGRNFSSLNDIKQHYGTGDIWFTDAQYGYLQSFRPPPQISPQVYRFEPLTGVVQAVADGFLQPNGFEFSPDFKTVYVTDSGSDLGEFGNNLTAPATIYAFDVVGEKYLQNRRMFAYSDNGIPDGIHTDVNGNVWAGCGDGIHVWNPQGALLGKLGVEGGVNNFAFLPGGILVENANRLFLVEGLQLNGREIARDFGLH